MTRPLTSRTLRDLIRDRSRLRRDTRGGQIRYILNGRQGFKQTTFLISAVSLAEKEIEAGATGIQIRCRPDHPWVDFPVKREAPAQTRVSRERIERAAREGR